MKKLLFLFLILTAMVKTSSAQEDPFIWLEEVENPKALVPIALPIRGSTAISFSTFGRTNKIRVAFGDAHH